MLVKGANACFDWLMRAGILIVGSLLWDTCQEREQWRAGRLLLDRRASVGAPICYGRRARTRGDTYTMIFDPARPGGRAVLLECRHEVNSVDDVVAEAKALWSAERKTDQIDGIGAEWGCVGVLFNGAGTAELRKQWTGWFGESGTLPVGVVTGDGIVCLQWPTAAARRLGLDLILTTATRRKGEQGAGLVADAWIGQNGGYEEYFFNNVANKVRTPDDLAIWRRMEERQPRWLARGEYRRAVAILRREAARVAAGDG